LRIIIDRSLPQLPTMFTHFVQQLTRLLPHPAGGVSSAPDEMPRAADALPTGWTVKRHADAIEVFADTQPAFRKPSEDPLRTA